MPDKVSEPAILSESRLAAIRKADLADNATGTHWVGCEASHPRCARRALLSGHDALTALLRRTAEALDLTFLGRADSELLAELREAGVLS